jgi:predicted site-specific integrase-resolvase
MEQKWSKLLTLQEWAKRRYDQPPSMRTLRRWVHDAKILPPPIKEGRRYLVRENATYSDWSVNGSPEAHGG